MGCSRVESLKSEKAMASLQVGTECGILIHARVYSILSTRTSALASLAQESPPPPAWPLTSSPGQSELPEEGRTRFLLLVLTPLWPVHGLSSCSRPVGKRPPAPCPPPSSLAWEGSGGLDGHVGTMDEAGQRPFPSSLRT